MSSASPPSKMTAVNPSIPGLGDGVAAFFTRCGLSPDVQEQCCALARELFPGERIEEARPQGYCSYTLCVGTETILQFRPPAYKLRMSVAEAACDVYGELAPRTRLLAVLRPPRHPSLKGVGKDLDGTEPLDEGVVMEADQDCLDAVSMARIRGTSLPELRASFTTGLLSLSMTRESHRSVISQFARFVATGLRHCRQGSDVKVSDLRGRVGGSLRWRLEQMHAHLPVRFRHVTNSFLNSLEKITSIPWVLTHGDIVPANIMVEPSKSNPGRLNLTGLLDWAEAEYLPFGVGLYGLEELLGETGADGRFSHYAEQGELRGLFWTQLEAELSCLGFALNDSSRAIVDAAHALGVLLWHGFAFDGGRLDRVVQEGVDDEEILRLDLFFAGHGLMSEDD